MIMIISKPITWRQQTTLYDDNDGQTMTSPRVLGLSWEAQRVIHLSQDVFSKHQWPNRGHRIKEGTSQGVNGTIDNGHQELILLFLLTMNHGIDGWTVSFLPIGDQILTNQYSWETYETWTMTLKWFLNCGPRATCPRNTWKWSSNSSWNKVQIS